MRVGILDVLSTPASSWSETAYNVFLTKQYASITPQAIAVWCRQLGHQTFYATYYGVGDPKRRLPDDLDIVFIATYSQASALAYALAKLYRREGTVTVIGGPHAKAFPTDCVRFFDLAVGTCDRALIADILRGQFATGSIVSSARPMEEIPSVEERMPEIRASAFAWGRRPYATTAIPLLASIGCPYACDFCTDWDASYRLLPLGRLAADLDYGARNLPGVLLAFHDPNFAVRFDAVLDTMETVPSGLRNPYLIETSLSILRADRLPRLSATNCASVAPGIESWSEYSNKAGVGRLTGAEKVARLVEHFTALHDHVPYLQANFLFGLDDDGDEFLELTKDFVSRTPFVWPVVNVPHPFGGTPLYSRYLAEGRILTAMPFSFYYSPYVVTTLERGSPARYYRQLIDLFDHFTAPAILLRRLATTSSQFVRAAHIVRTRTKRRRIRMFRRLLDLLVSDRGFRDFHEGRSAALPEFYQREYERMLGPYASLMSRAERTPHFEADSEPASAVPVSAATRIAS